MVQGLWWISEEKSSSLVCTFVACIIEGLRAHLQFTTYPWCSSITVSLTGCGFRFEFYLKRACFGGDDNGCFYYYFKSVFYSVGNIRVFTRKRVWGPRSELDYEILFCYVGKSTRNQCRKHIIYLWRSTTIWRIMTQSWDQTLEVSSGTVFNLTTLSFELYLVVHFYCFVLADIMCNMLAMV